MFSDQSQKYFQKENKILYEKFKKNPSFTKFLSLIKKGQLPRPHYGLCLLLAAMQAKDLGLNKLKIIELGCANFDGLVDIENYVHDIQSFLDIEVELFGFTLKEGLPKYKINNFDRLYGWQPGDYSLESDKNQKKLKTSKIYFGDIKETIPKFLKDFENTFVDSPLGLIFFDLDYYTSTKIGLELLNMDSNNYLPRTYTYFDDHSFSAFDEGERRAIYEFNKESENNISDIGELAEQLSIHFNKWIFLGKRIKVINYYENKNFSKKTSNPLGFNNYFSH
ncbi:hypothetical protein N9770_03255 [Amylibacter sp.]|nr:hypothetical protein [Amylibacter sp.]